MGIIIIISLILIYVIVGYMSFNSHKFNYGTVWNTPKVLHAVGTVVTYIILGVFLAVLIYLIATM